MDKGKLKNFAIEARKRLIDHVGARIRYILTHETVEFVAKADLVNKLRAAWENSNDHDAFIERHAYTLFNRLIALRYMDVKGYNFVPVVSPRATGGDPAILADARNGIFQPDLPIDRERVSALLGGKVPAANPFNEAFKLLFIGACAGFNKTMPFMFEPLNSYAELLLPDDLLSANSIVAFINSNLGEEECENVEVVGWLYQYYISEKKDVASDKIKKNQVLSKGEIIAYTQIFTRKWIVKYLVENSLGRLWLKNNKNSTLKDKMQFFLNEDELSTDNSPQITQPEEIRLLDPSCGSGHMLVYMFELLVHMYSEAGYYIKDIPELILKNNLFGLDIDPRAVSLSSFALIMKAMDHDRNIISKGITPNVFVLDKSLNPLTGDEYDEPLFDNFDILGSLIVPERNIFSRTKDSDDTEELINIDAFNKLERRNKIFLIFNSKFHAVITNPPYLNPSTNPVIKEYVNKKYPRVKGDLFACFIERSIEWVVSSGYVSLVTMQSWMFLSSFEKFRDWLIENHRLVTLGHYDNMVMGIAFGTSGFTLQKGQTDVEDGTYYKVALSDLDANDQVANFGELPKYYYAQSNFSKIPGSPIAYWVSERVIEVFTNSKTLDNYGNAKQGLITGNNELFLRFWYEIQGSFQSTKKWYPYQKGGEYRKYYGNIELVVNWENDGDAIKNYKDDNGKLLSRPQNIVHYFKEGITWTALTSSNFNARFSSDKFIFDAKGPLFICNQNQNLFQLLGFLNCKVSSLLFAILSPTMDFTQGMVNQLPVNAAIFIKDEISKLIKINIDISKSDWDARETSWDFKASPLLTAGDSPLLEERYLAYRRYWANKFFELHRNEEELNRIFIDIYGLQEELTPDVELKDVTILQQEKIITEEGGLAFNTAEVVRQFISYAVGCMFGRYSLDAPGLILANQGETLSDYLAKVPEPRFTPDDDNIIPVLDDEYFHDDIVFRFNRFLETALGSEGFDRNLQFIESALGMTLRRYFTNEFYKDHLKRYKKRPIYWMVSSPAGSFKALIYMHRYNTQTMSKIYNDYLKEFASKLNARLKDLQDGIIHTPNPVREEEKLRRAIKDTEDLLIALTPFALNPVEIDLDDGVKANLLKFKGAVVQV